MHLATTRQSSLVSTYHFIKLFQRDLDVVKKVLRASQNLRSESVTAFGNTHATGQLSVAIILVPTVFSAETRHREPRDETLGDLGSLFFDTC